MSVQVRRRREAASFLQTYVGAQGELLVDTTNNRVQVHDGATPGGWPAAKLADVAQRTSVADASYTAQAGDRLVAFSAVTAARTLTLPAASAFPTGTQLLVVDEAGGCSATNTITISRAGSDTINGAASAVISLAYGYLALESNGSSRWTVVDQSTASMAQQAAGNVAITGGAVAGLTSLGFSAAAGAAGAINKLDFFGGAYGLGISFGSLDLVTGGAFSFYSSGTKIATFNSGGLNAALGAATPNTIVGTTIRATASLALPSYTVATLPAAGTGGRLVHCSNARMFNGQGALEAAGAGSGGLVVDTGSAWKIAGTNATASA